MEVPFLPVPEDSTANICVTLSGAATLARDVIVTVSTQNGDAQGINWYPFVCMLLSYRQCIIYYNSRFVLAPGDYIAIQSMGLTFEPSTPLTRCVDIFINADDLFEIQESLLLFIEDPQADPAVTVGVPGSGVILIQDINGEQ